MITKEQIEKYSEQNNGLRYSKPLFAILDCDYQTEDYVIPAGTIAQVRLYTSNIADLYVNDKFITGLFPYDAATLLEDE